MAVRLLRAGARWIHGGLLQCCRQRGFRPPASSCKMHRYDSSTYTPLWLACSSQRDVCVHDHAAVHVDHRGAQLSCNGLTTRACVLLGLREAGAALQKVNARVRHFGTVFTFLVSSSEHMCGELCVLSFVRTAVVRAQHCATCIFSRKSTFFRGGGRQRKRCAAQSATRGLLAGARRAARSPISLRCPT